MATQGKRTLDIIITATAKGISDATKKAGSDIKSGFAKGRLAVKAFNDTVGNGHRAVSAISGGIKTLLAGVVGFQALRNATNIMRDADNAAFSMQTSVAAANREFENVGSVSDWEQTVRRLSDELRIYSDTALKSAVSRTVDMTKRLGLSKEQMEEVIKRSADLGAGKVELEGAIERVTAALRGEAESAEFLGLTLNENYVKAWYEANKVTEKAWKDLTDLEKAQVRYRVLLEQSDSLQGRAAKSADTFNGALQEIRKEIVNAVSNSKNLQKAMQDVAAILKINAGKIGEVISTLVTAAARVAEFAIAWKGLIIALAATVATLSVVSKLVTLVKGLNAAFTVLMGKGIIPWLGKLRSGLIAASSQTVTLSTTLGKAGLAGVIAGTAVSVGLAVKAFYEWRVAAKESRDAQDRLRENADALMRKYEEFKDVKLPDNLTALAQDDLVRLRKELAKARAYYVALKNTLETKAQETTLFGTATDEAREAQKQLFTVNARLKEIQEDFIQVGKVAGESAEGMKKPAQAVMATEEQLDKFEEQAKKVYESARKDAEKYAQEVIKWEEKIKYSRLSTEDKIRELGRKTMSDEEAWADRRRQAEEKVSDAKEAKAKKDYKLTQKLIDDAQGLYADLAEEVTKSENGQDIVVKSLEETTKIAQNGLSELQKFAEQLYTEQQNTAKNALDDVTKVANAANEQLDWVARAREANIEIQLKGLEAAQSAINQLLKPGTKHITVVTHQVEAKQTGGLAGGGKLAGYGGGDRIRALLEAGEFVVRKEAVAKYGASLFHALNAMKLDLSGAVKARIGGMISNISIPAPQFAFQGGGAVPSPSSGETMTIRFQAGDVEMPLSVAGNRTVTRQMVKQFEQELIKLGLARR